MSLVQIRRRPTAYKSGITKHGTAALTWSVSSKTDAAIHRNMKKMLQLARLSPIAKLSKAAPVERGDDTQMRVTVDSTKTHECAVAHGMHWIVRGKGDGANTLSVYRVHSARVWQPTMPTHARSSCTTCWGAC